MNRAPPSRVPTPFICNSPATYQLFISDETIRQRPRCSHKPVSDRTEKEYGSRMRDRTPRGTLYRKNMPQNSYPHVQNPLSSSASLLGLAIVSRHIKSIRNILIKGRDRPTERREVLIKRVIYNTKICC